MVQLALSGPNGQAIATDIARRWAARTATRAGLDDAIAGILKEEGGDRGAAETLYAKSLQADAARVVAAQRLFALLPEGRRAPLEPILRRALLRDPRIDEYHNLLGILLAESGRAREALQEFRRAEELDPENPRFRAGRAADLVRHAHVAELVHLLLRQVLQRVILNPFPVVQNVAQSFGFPQTENLVELWPA